MTIYKGFREMVRLLFKILTDRFLGYFGRATTLTGATRGLSQPSSTFLLNVYKMITFNDH